jgi:hypothetical protein
MVRPLTIRATLSGHVNDGDSTSKLLIFISKKHLQMGDFTEEINMLCSNDAARKQWCGKQRVVGCK